MDHNIDQYFNISKMFNDPTAFASDTHLPSFAEDASKEWKQQLEAASEFTESSESFRNFLADGDNTSSEHTVRNAADTDSDADPKAIPSIEYDHTATDEEAEFHALNNAIQAQFEAATQAPDIRPETQATEHVTQEEENGPTEAIASEDQVNEEHIEVVKEVDLRQYRPAAIPPFRGRRSQTAGPEESEWKIPADWPPRNPSSRDDLFQDNILLFPPKDAPLHVHIQSYALRWGTWSASIEDFSRRQEVLKHVSAAMGKSWNNAVNLGYYAKPLPNGTERSGDEDENEAAIKTSRKRAVSPSREPAGFAAEGKDALAVTKGELERYDLTMAIINDRVARQDLQEGRDLYARVLEQKGGQLDYRDWSRSAFSPVVNGRNLVMYALYAVQENEKQCKKMEILLRGFKGKTQIKNTNTRLETYKLAAAQHLALAIDVQAKETVSVSDDEEEATSEVEDIEGQEESLDSSSANISAESSHGSQTPPQATEDTFTKEEKHLIESAKAIVAAPNIEAIMEVLRAKQLGMAHFHASTGIRVNNDLAQNIKAVIWNMMGYLSSFNDARKQLSSHRDDPPYVMRLQHDIRLSRAQVDKVQTNLRKCLVNGGIEIDAAEPSAIPPNQGTHAESSGNVLHSAQSYVPMQSPSNGLAAHRMTGYVGGLNTMHQQAHVVGRGGSTPAPPSMMHNKQSPSTPQQVTGVQSAARSSAPYQKMPLQQQLPLTSPGQSSRTFQSSNAQPLQTPPRHDAALTRLYINQIWVPRLAARFGRDPKLLENTLSDWSQVYELIKRNGFADLDMQDTHKNFVKGFEVWKQQLHQSMPVTPQSITRSSPSMASNIPADQKASASPRLAPFQMFTPPPSATTQGRPSTKPLHQARGATVGMASPQAFTPSPRTISHMMSRSPSVTSTSPMSPSMNVLLKPDTRAPSSPAMTRAASAGVPMALMPAVTTNPTAMTTFSHAPSSMPSDAQLPDTETLLATGSGFPTVAELEAALPPGGIDFQEYMHKFAHRVTFEQQEALIEQMVLIGHLDESTNKISRIQDVLSSDYPPATNNLPAMSPTFLPTTVSDAVDPASLQKSESTNAQSQLSGYMTHGLASPVQQHNWSSASMPPQVGQPSQYRIKLHMPNHTEALANMQSQTQTAQSYYLPPNTGQLNDNDHEAEEYFYPSTLNKIRDFHFRYRLESSVEQRMETEEIVSNYVESLYGRGKRKPWGKYVSLDELTGGHPVVHGVWNTKNGGMAEGFEWFYKGDGSIPDWAENLGGDEDEDELPRGTKRGRGGNQGGDTRRKKIKKGAMEDDDDSGDWQPDWD